MKPRLVKARAMKTTWFCACDDHLGCGSSIEDAYRDWLQDKALAEGFTLSCPKEDNPPITTLPDKP